MTSVSLIAPYAPQPAATASADLPAASSLALKPSGNATSSGNTGSSTGQSGSGAGNGTGTGGSDRALAQARLAGPIPPNTASPKSVVDAQLTDGPAAEYLARMREQQRHVKLETSEQTLADEAAEKRAEKEAQAAKDKEDFVMPNPLPTAPILMRDEN